MLKVAWLYPKPKRAALEAWRRGEEPDHLSAISALPEFGITAELVDPLPRPWNPFADGHSLHSGIDPLRAFRLAARLSEFDAVVSVGESSGLVLLALRPLMPRKVPILVWDPAVGGDWSWRERVLRWALPRYDRILVVGSNQVPLIHERYPGAAPAEAVGHWEDLDFYRPSPPPADGPILSVGVDPMRDYALLAEAARGLPARVVIKTNRALGTAPPPNVEVMRERISHAALRDLYASARAVVVPLRDAHHASGVNGVLEAYAMGRPLIVSDSSGIRDFVVPGETALVVPPGDGAALRRALDALLASPDLALGLAARGRALAESRFGRRAFAARMADCLWRECRRLGEAATREKGCPDVH